MNKTISHPGDDTASAKQSLRNSIRQLRDRIAPRDALAAARSAAAYLMALPQLAGVSVVALYMAMPGELDPSPAAAMLGKQGMVPVYPRVVPGQAVLAFHRVSDPGELVRGTLGIREPAATAPEALPGEIGLFVVPGLAFDRHGRRLGWGKGYYDATLARCPDAIRVGFAHHCQLVAEVPVTARDVPMDILITDAGVFATGARSLGKNP